MASERPFIERTERWMGDIYVGLTVENGRESRGSVSCRAMVDTGAFGVILPTAWKTQLGDLRELSMVDLELADQRVVRAEIRGPVIVQIEGFRRVSSEVVFVDMEPRADGSYEPLIGYTVLELANVVIDMRSHSLVAKKYYKLKRCAA
jgi:predicted aspartyl protease